MDNNNIQQHQRELCTKLWSMANALRGNMEAYESSLGSIAIEVVVVPSSLFVSLYSL